MKFKVIDVVKINNNTFLGDIFLSNNKWCICLLSGLKGLILLYILLMTTVTKSKIGKDTHHAANTG